MTNLAEVKPEEDKQVFAYAIEREHKPIFVSVTKSEEEQKVSFVDFALMPVIGRVTDRQVIDLKDHIEHVVSKTKGKFGKSDLEAFNKAEGATAVKVMAAASLQGCTLGRKWQPFNFRAISEFQSSNPWHAACIATKKNSLVGLGFRGRGEAQPAVGGSLLNAQMQQTVLAQNKIQAPGTPGQIDPQNMSQTMAQRQVLTEADKLLNPLTTHTFRDVCLLAAEDYEQVGNGYLEVVRRKGTGEITGIHHIPAADVWVWVEDYEHNYHYEVMSLEGIGGSRHFARWGDTDAFLKRQSTGLLSSWFNYDGTVTKDMVSEVIHFRKPSSKSRYYGFPDWLAAVPKIELAMCLDQYKYDFFLNRGVPEFMLFITGQTKMTPTDWTTLTNSLKGNIGLGNSHKTVALNLVGQYEIKIEKLGTEGKSEGQDYSTQVDTFAMAIVTCHRVPPLLAGIQIPGKLGANNELPNALMAFQVLVMGPEQEQWQQTLGMTLGNKEQNGGLDLTEEDFHFRTITEQIDIGTLATQSAMRQTVPEAKAQGRDMSAGLKT